LPAIYNLLSFGFNYNTPLHSTPSFLFFLLRGHSNNMRYFFSWFLTPPSSCDTLPSLRVTWNFSFYKTSFFVAFRTVILFKNVCKMSQKCYVTLWWPLPSPYCHLVTVSHTQTPYSVTYYLNVSLRVSERDLLIFDLFF